MLRCFVFSVLTLFALDARAADSVTRAACTPRAQLDAAGAALAAGDRSRAERQLRRAQEQAAACERRLSRADAAYARAARGAAPAEKRNPGASQR